ncbi:unnamed protein product, partial [marine sediment metagenome]
PKYASISMGAYLTLHKYTNKFYEINQIKK